MKNKRRTFASPTPLEQQAKAFSQTVDFWRRQAIENMKRALRAEVRLAEFEGPIGS